MNWTKGVDGNTSRPNGRVLILTKKDEKTKVLALEKVATFDGGSCLDFPSITEDSSKTGFGFSGIKEWTFGVSELPSKLVSLGKRRIPDFDMNLGVEEVEYHLFQSNSLPENNTLIWESSEEILSKFEKGELIISTLTLHVIRNLHQSKNIEEFVEMNRTETQHKSIVLQSNLEFSKGIFSVPLKSNTIIPFSHTNLIYFYSQQELLLVDPGSNEDGKENLISLLKRFSDVKKVLVFLTHHHHDHWEALQTVHQFFPSATVLAHSGTLNRMKCDFPFQNLSENAKIVVGELEIEGIYSPGHTDGSMSLWHPKSRTLVAGDHVVGFGSAVLDSIGGGDMQNYFHTTHRFIKLNPRIILPAHGPPSFNPIQLLNTYIKHRQAREDAIFAAYQAGNTSLDEIVKVVYADVSPDLWEKAKANIYLHLKKLHNEGKVPKINL